MKTIDSIIIHAAPEAIFRAAVEIEHWPQLLPHYRWVNIISDTGERRTVEMAARCGWIPVKWRSEQWFDRSAYCIFYYHIGGTTQGMSVKWSIEPCGDGVHVSIVHQLTLKHFFVRTMLGKWIVGHWFVKPVAQRTLSHIKQLMEEKICAEQSSPE